MIKKNYLLFMNFCSNFKYSQDVRDPASMGKNVSVSNKFNIYKFLKDQYYVRLNNTDYSNLKHNFELVLIIISFIKYGRRKHGANRK